MSLFSNVKSNAPVICNHCPPSPTYGEGWGIAGLKCRAITFQVSPQRRGNDRVLTLGFLPQGDFLLLRAGQSKVLTSSSPPGGGAYSRALKAEKSLSPPFPVGGGAVVTNDLCITCTAQGHNTATLGVKSQHLSSKLTHI